MLMAIESFMLFAFSFNVCLAFFVINLFKEKDLLSIVSSTVGVILHDLLNGIWRGQVTFMLGILQIKTFIKQFKVMSTS